MHPQKAECIYGRSMGRNCYMWYEDSSILVAINGEINMGLKQLERGLLLPPYISIRKADAPLRVPLTWQSQTILAGDDVP